MVVHRTLGAGLVVVAAAFLLAAVALLAFPRGGSAQTPTPAAGSGGVANRSVSVVGNGEVKAAPDQAVVTIGVESEAATAEEALDDNNSKMDVLLKALRDAGIASRDMQTSGFSIYPVYADSSSGQAPRVSGYRVSNQVLVTVRALGSLGEILDRVVRVGANQIYGVAFGFNDPQGLLDQARERAMQDARRKANQLATLGGATLGQVVVISESGATPPPPVIMERAAMDVASAASVPVEVGEQSLSVSVQVTYALR